MKYTERNKTKFVGIESFFRDYPGLKGAEAHPQYNVFKETLSSWGLRENYILYCWKLLIDGIVEQRNLNWTAEQTTSSMISESGLNAYSCGDSEYAQICKNIFHKISKAEDQLTFYKSVMKASNPHYANFANSLKNYLSTGSKELSLWSGGYDLSPFSSKFGNCPLEQTQLGMLLDTLPLTTEWKLEAPLWNIISRTFVRSYQGRDVHVYIRTIDKESVLLRQEIPMLNKMGKTDHWHIFYNNGTQFAKVGYERVDGKLIPKAINADELLNGYDQKTAFELLGKIITSNQSQFTTNQRAYYQMIKEFPEYRAPFAFYE